MSDSVEKVDKNQIEKYTLPQIKQLLVVNLDDLQLNNKQKIFVAVYCNNGFNERNAYLSAGYAGRRLEVVRAAAQKLVATEKIQEAIKRMIGELVKPYLAPMKMKTFELQFYRAFWKIDDFFYPDGAIKPLSEISEKAKYALDGIETKLYGQKGTKIITYTLADRSEALRQIQALLDKYDSGNQAGESLEELRKKRDAIFGRDYNSLPDKKIIGIEEGRK